MPDLICESEGSCVAVSVTSEVFLLFNKYARLSGRLRDKSKFIREVFESISESGNTVSCDSLRQYLEERMHTEAHT